MKSQVGLLPGIDLRGDGGYVVAPGSLHSNGKQYVWFKGRSPSKVPLPSLPGGLLKKLTEKPSQDGARNGEGELIPEGQRNDRLTQLAGAMRSQGMTEEGMAAALLVENERRCEPPLEDAEVLGIARSISKYPPSRANEAREIEPEKWPELSSEALYGLAGDVVRTIDPYSEADPVATLTNLLAGFGALVGRRPHAKVLADEHPARLFFAQVGATGGGRKGMASSVVVGMLREVDPLLRYKPGGLSSGEGLIWELRDPIYERHPIKEKGRVTGYQKVETDEGVEDKRLFLVEPEFATVLKVLERQGNSLSGILRCAWDGHTLAPMTKHNRVSASDTHPALIAHITREELLRYLTETERANGFANRFIFVLVRRSKIIPNPKPIPDSLLKPLIKRLQRAFEHADDISEITRTDQAAAEWEPIYAELSEGKSGLFGAIVGRAEAQVLRLSVAYALLDCSQVIESAHQRAALGLWKYAQQSARLIFGAASGDPVADTIVGALRDSGELDRTTIYNLFGRHVPSARIQKALELLVNTGMAHPTMFSTEGRAREVWRAGIAQKA